MRWSMDRFYRWKGNRRRRQEEWHLWFAWFPVRMESNLSSFRWLEKVYRKAIGVSTTWYIYDDPLIVRIKENCQKVSDEILEEDNNQKNRVIG